jgi:hypothetical protein
VQPMLNIAPIDRKNPTAEVASRLDAVRGNTIPGRNDQ